MPFSIRKPFKTSVVDVPIRVIIPPQMVANDRGMSSFEGDTLFFFPQLNTYGVRVATTGVLFRKDEIIATWHIILKRKDRYDLADLYTLSK